MTNSLRLPVIALVVAIAFVIFVAMTAAPGGLIPLSELQIGAVGGALALTVFGVQGIVSVALEGRELRPGISPPRVTNPLSAGIVLVSLFLFTDALFLGYGVVVGWDTARLGVAAALGCFFLAVILIFYKEAFLGDEACLDDREDGIPW